MDILSYAAGIIDGEGCITLVRRKEGQCQAVFRVSMCDKEPLEILSGLFGSTPRLNTRNDGRSFWHWTLTGIKAYKALKIISDYLIVKKQAAEIAMAYQETVNYQGFHGEIPSETIIEREILYYLMQEITSNKGKHR